jgi:glycosyltransferase involved in cell wall biosynthesis
VQWPAFLRLLPRTDVFHFYFGWTLIPRKLTWPLLKATRRKSVLHFLGSDIRGKTPDELRYVRRADARIVGSYDALRWVPDAHVVPPGLDLREYARTNPGERSRPVVLHAPSSRRRKGTEHVVEACEGLDVELDIVEGLPHAEARRHYQRADIVVDQLNAGWYGIFALEAMALGLPVLSYLRPEAVQETERAVGVDVPIVTVTKETLRDRIAALAASPDERARIGALSRTYVEHVHDADKGADRLIAIYRSL